MYTLYHGTGACSLAISAALTLAGQTFETKTLKLMEGEQLKPDYLKINPQGKVPSLATEKGVITEGLAILLYLAEKYPNAQLLPSEASERVETFRWLSILYTALNPHYSHLFSPHRYGNDLDSIKTKAEEGVYSIFALINTQLEKNDYISGDSLRAPDLYLAVVLHWTSVLTVNLESSFKSLSEYKDRIYSHPIIGDIYKQEFGINA